MAYSEELALRIRAALGDRDDVVEKKMFGGLAFMVAGSMAVGVMGDDLLARVGAEGHAAAMKRPHTRVMEFTGRPMQGFVIVDAAGVARAPSLKKWVAECVAFVTSPSHRERQRSKKRARRARAR